VLSTPVDELNTRRLEAMPDAGRALSDPSLILQNGIECFGFLGKFGIVPRDNLIQCKIAFGSDKA